MNVPLLVILAAAAVLVAAGLVVVLLVVLATRRRLESALVSSRADVDALREQLAELASRVSADSEPEPGPDDSRRGYLITTLPDGGRPHSTVAVRHPEAVGRLTAGEFAGVALGESLVRVLSLGYGVRRALSAENRSRIRFEMRREVKRSRKQRRRDLKEAKRHLRADQRADLTEDAA